jgi:ceramide glucosyltransferase
MTDLEVIAVVFAALALLDRAWRAFVIHRFFQRPALAAPTTAARPVHVTILQPVVSGDPLLERWLEGTVRMKSAVSFDVLWLLDHHDLEAHRICERIARAVPDRCRALDVAPPGEREAPKLKKLVAGVHAARGDVLVALDDDTMLADHTLERVLPHLDRAGLVFLLPCYTSFQNLWSRLVAFFVNANAFSTFIASEVATGSAVMPGMFWAMRRETVRALGDLQPFIGAIVDHEALSIAVRKLGLSMELAPATHDLSTMIPNARAYFRLMHRWFAYAKNGFVREMDLRTVIASVALGLLPATLPVASTVVAIVSPSFVTLSSLGVTFFAQWSLFAYVNARHLRGRSPWRHSWLVVVVQLLLPIQIILGLVLPARLHWRGNVIELDGKGGFRFLHRANGSP